MPHDAFPNCCKKMPSRSSSHAPMTRAQIAAVARRSSSLPPHGHERGSPPHVTPPRLPHGCKRGSSSPPSAFLLLPMGEKHFHKSVVQITKIKNLISELIIFLSAGMRCCRDCSCALRWISGSNSSIFGRWHTLNHVYACIHSQRLLLFLLHVLS